MPIRTLAVKYADCSEDSQLNGVKRLPEKRPPEGARLPFETYVRAVVIIQIILGVNGIG